MTGNRICEMLKIYYPIIQAPMNWVSGAALAAAVSNAGGLGTLGPNAGADSITADVELTGERLRDQIKKTKSQTKNPFAVNIPIGVGDGRTFSAKCIDVVIEEEVPVVITSVGPPNVYTKMLKDSRIKVFHAVSTATQARKAEETGVDAVICEGFEAGGHKGFTELTTLVLTPMVSDAVKIPVITGGGIGDARGMLAAFTLGADAVYMGTRFMATKESESHQYVKDAIVRANDVCTVSLPKEYMLARDLGNIFTEKYLEMQKTGASSAQLNAFLAEHSQYRGQHLGDSENGEIGCGQVAGLISDISSAASVIETIIKNLPFIIKDLNQKLANVTCAD